MEFLIQYPDYKFKIIQHPTPEYPTGRFIEDYRNFNNPQFYH